MLLLESRYAGDRVAGLPKLVDQAHSLVREAHDGRVPTVVLEVGYALQTSVVFAGKRRDQTENIFIRLDVEGDAHPEGACTECRQQCPTNVRAGKNADQTKTRRNHGQSIDVRLDELMRSLFQWRILPCRDGFLGHDFAYRPRKLD